MAILFGSARFTLVRGTRWTDDVVLTDSVTQGPIDLTGLVGAIMRVREAADDTAHLLELSVANGMLVIVDATGGTIGIRVPSAVTRTFPENSNESALYVYDVVLERSAGEYEAAVAGKINVRPQITRPWAAT